MTRVLFYNHTSVVSGAEHSLLSLLAALADQPLEAVLACPEGDLLERARAAGIATIPTRGTAGSFRLHPLRTPEAMREMGAAAVALARVSRSVRPSAIDANSVRSGLIGVHAQALGGPPVVVRVRDVLPKTIASAVVARIVRSRSRALLANSWHTAQRFPGGRGGELRVVHPAIDIERFGNAGPRAAVRSSLGVGDDTPLLAVVAQITPWKGQADAIRMLELLRRTHPDARLLLIGETKFVGASTRYDNRAYLDRLRAGALSLGDGAVTFLGERSDVADLLTAADLALIPSWEEPFGRSVVEAMAAGVPVIATASGGPREVIRNGEDGFLLAPRDPERWAALAARLLDDPIRRASVAERARHAATRYDHRRQAAELPELYRSLDLI